MRVFLLMTMLLGLNVFSVQAKDDESLIKSFTLIKWDAVAHAKINEKECLLEFKHLPSGNLVTGVNYELAKGGKMAKRSCVYLEERKERS